MSLQRTLRRRQRRLEPRMIGKLYRASALVHVRRHGLAEQDSAAETRAVRDIVRALRNGKLFLDLDPETEIYRIRPADPKRVVKTTV